MNVMKDMKMEDSRDLLIAALHDEVQFLREVTRLLLYERAHVTEPIGQFEIGAALRDRRKQP